MSATKPQTRAEQFLIEESESLSQILYNKPFNALDEVRQARITASAKRALKDRIFYEPQPGECFSCGRVAQIEYKRKWVALAAKGESMEYISKRIVKTFKIDSEGVSLPAPACSR